MSEQDDLIGDMIAEVARTHGVAIARDDPVVAVVLLNQVVLRRYLEQAVAPATEAIRAATREAIDQVEKIAEAQAHWLDQVSLKDRASFLEEQKALHEAWKAELQALIDGQNASLQQVLVQTIALLRASSAPAAPPPQKTPVPPAPTKHWTWISTGALLGAGTTAVLALTAVAWAQLAAR